MRFCESQTLNYKVGSGNDMYFRKYLNLITQRRECQQQPLVFVDCLSETMLTIPVADIDFTPWGCQKDYSIVTFVEVSRQSFFPASILECCGGIDQAPVKKDYT